MEVQSLTDLLRGNPYPGRGIVLGRSADGTKSVAAYFIMGRSENSRNRIFAPTKDGIRTQAHDPSKMTDPSLIIYHPVREDQNGNLIVSNGDQTDDIRDALRRESKNRPLDVGENAAACARALIDALQTRTFEPDAPHYTPRISGLLCPNGAFWLSILKAAEGHPHCCRRAFWHSDAPPAGEGRFLHTYQGDGNPLPSFEGEPIRVRLDAPDAAALAEQIWTALHPENRVALFVRCADIARGVHEDKIINQFGA